MEPSIDDISMPVRTLAERLMLPCRIPDGKHSLCHVKKAETVVGALKRSYSEGCVEIRKKRFRKSVTM